MSKPSEVSPTEETLPGELRRRRKKHGRVTIFPNWCKGCHLCIEFCPAHVLGAGPDGRVVVEHPERCTACRWCELHCPDFALFVTEVGQEE